MQPETTPAGQLADGRYAAYLVEAEVASHTLTFDVIQFLTGEAAAEAYRQDHPDDPEGPPNDYYIVNDDPGLRTEPVSKDVRVRLVRLGEDSDADLDPGTFEVLP
ncbi:MAG: hypothetical protein ACRD0D_09055, partial [Acidimicrobiales bacterium]